MPFSVPRVPSGMSSCAAASCRSTTSFTTGSETSSTLVQYWQTTLIE
jgi:hypothetical protein